MKIRTNVRAGLAGDRCGGTRCGGTRCGGGGSTTTERYAY